MIFQTRLLLLAVLGGRKEVNILVVKGEVFCKIFFMVWLKASFLGGRKHIFWVVEKSVFLGGRKQIGLGGRK